MAMKHSLTERELQALKHIRNFLMRKARTPSIRELRDSLGYKSPRSAAVIVDSLVSKGFLSKKTDGSLRLVRLPQEEDHHTQTVDIPLVGRVAAGLPILAQENIESYIPVSVRWARPPHRYYLLHVSGDSMNNAGINNQDLALVRIQDTADNGDKVVALINEEATIKEFHRTKNAIILKPKSKNPKHKPIILTEDFRIQGVVLMAIPKP